LCSFHLLEGNAQNLQARLQQIINQELPDVFPENNTDFEEAQELEIKPVNPKGNQPFIFTGGAHAEAEAPILCPPDAKSQLIGNDSGARKD